MELFDVLEATREKAPLVQCITNFVTVNDCANILLAAGASPTMADHILEVEDTIAAANGLVCNMGTLERTEAMLLAGKRANALGKPVVLDPVAAGANPYRQETAERLMKGIHFTAIRGNASEIRALASGEAAGSGVDVSLADVVTRENLPQAAQMTQELARRTGAVIAISGVMDVVSDAEHTAVFENGCATMARVTGSGCMLTTLMGGFCAAVPDEPFTAACAAMAVMGVCGELAEEKRIKNHTGNATFRTDMIDAVFTLTEKELKEKLRYELYQG